MVGGVKIAAPLLNCSVEWLTLLSVLTEIFDFYKMLIIFTAHSGVVPKSNQ